jgi:hypothetical protein
MSTKFQISRGRPRRKRHHGWLRVSRLKKDERAMQNAKGIPTSAVQKPFRITKAPHLPLDIALWQPVDLNITQTHIHRRNGERKATSNLVQHDSAFDRILITPFDIYTAQPWLLRRHEDQNVPGSS